MEFVYWAVGILWCIGAISEIAKMDRRIYLSSEPEPYTGAFLVVKLLIFFTWPYWYFYDRAA